MLSGLGNLGGGAFGGLDIPSGAPTPDRAPAQDSPTAPTAPMSPF